MEQLLTLISALLMGVALAYLYFLGLWWTVRQAVSRSRPFLWIAGSFVLRVVGLLGVFSLLLSRGWPSLAVGFLGLIVVRLVVVKRWGIDEPTLNQNLEQNHGI